MTTSSSSLDRVNCYEQTDACSIAPIGYILIAIGIITLIGGTLAAGYLYQQMGNVAFSFAGGGLATCTISILIAHYFCRTTVSNESERQGGRIHNLDLKPNVSVSRPLSSEMQQSLKAAKFDRKPCNYEGLTCFINTSLHTVAHLPNFRWLFDETLNKLEKRDNESDDSFAKRKKVQTEGKRLIDSILRGERVTHVRSFVNTVQESLIALGVDSSHLQINTLGSGSAAGLTECCGLILFSRYRNSYYFMVNAGGRRELDDLKEDFKPFLNAELYPRGDSSPILRFLNYDGLAYGPEIVIDGIGTYRLEVVETSTSHKKTGSIGHCTPIIRTENGKYLELDDLNNKVSEVSETALFRMLKGNKGWISAYYSKVRD